MSAVYALGKQGFMDGSLNWTSGIIKAMLVSAAYTPNVATDEYVSSIPSGAIIARSPSLTGLNAAGGIARADDVTLPAVSGPSVAYVVIYEDTGSDATSRLIAYVNTANGLPTTPNGGDISISWDTGPNHIFAL